jgi:RHS repeat-associated protein
VFPVGGGAGERYFPLYDHLGSTVGMLNIAGAIVSSQRYWPFGAARDAHVSPPLPLVTETDKLYTGQQIENGDSALGLYNYKARFYSTTLGGFSSADTSTQHGYNRFAYVRGNPTTYNDPTGHGLYPNDSSDVPCSGNHPECDPTAGDPGPVTAPVTCPPSLIHS